MSSEGTTPNTAGREDAGDEGPAHARRSRRAIIGGGLAAAGAGIAGTLLATASPAAADDTALLTGESNTATNTTSLSNTNGFCFEASSTSGQPVVAAFDDSSDNAGGSQALYGQSTVSAGVGGFSVNNAGVAGVGTGSGGVGVFGQGTMADGVYGQLDPTTTTAGIAAVFGFDPTAAPGNIGVFGESFNGTAVHGVASVNGTSAGTGVSGETYGNGGNGVQAFDLSTGGGLGLFAGTNNGIAISANVLEEGGGGGFALSVNGPSQFVTGATAVVPKGKSSVTVTAAWVTPASFVLATLQGPPNGHYVESAVAGNTTVTIHLNAAAGMDRTVGFFALVPNTVSPPARRRSPGPLGRGIARLRPRQAPKPIKP